MTPRCAPACSQSLPVKPQGVWARGIEAWAWSRDRRNLEFLRWGSSGPSSLMALALWRQQHSCTVCPMPRPKLNLVDFIKSWNYITLMIITNEHTSCDWIDFWPIICRIKFTGYGSGMVSWEKQNTAGVETTIDWLSDMHLKHTYNLLWSLSLQTLDYICRPHDIN